MSQWSSRIQQYYVPFKKKINKKKSRLETKLKVLVLFIACESEHPIPGCSSVFLFLNFGQESSTHTFQLGIYIRDTVVLVAYLSERRE